MEYTTDSQKVTIGAGSGKISTLWSGVLLVVFVPLAFGLVWLWSLYQKEVSTNKGVKSELGKLTEKRAFALEVAEIADPEKTALVRLALPPKKDFYNLVGQVGFVARQHAFVIDSFNLVPGELQPETENGDTTTTAKPQQSNTTEKMTATMRVKGPRAQYVDFIYNLETILPFLVIDKVDMVLTQETATLDLSVSSFFSPDQVGTIDIEKMKLSDLTLGKGDWTFIEELQGYERFEYKASVPDVVQTHQRNNPFGLDN